MSNSVELKQRATKTVVVLGHPAMLFYSRCRRAHKGMSFGHETADFRAPGAGLASWGTGNPPGQAIGTEVVQDGCVVKNMTCDAAGQCKQRKLAEGGTAP